MSQLTKYNQSFNFDWNDYRTIKPCKEQLAEVSSFLSKQENIDQAIKDGEQEELASLCYKLGTYYNHIKPDPKVAPDLAINYLSIAEKIFKDEKLAWVQNHLAFSYQQKLALAKRDKKQDEMAIHIVQVHFNCNVAIQNYFLSKEVSHIKICAFNDCVRALGDYEVDSIKEALANYRHALDLYETIGALDDQYARAKSRWAMMLGDDHQYEAAQKAFTELEDYWNAHQDPLNPYPARFYVSYADFIMKAYPDNLQLALDKYKKAHLILCVTDGNEAGFTQDIKKKVLALEEKISAQQKSNYTPTLHKPASNTVTENQPPVENTNKYGMK